MNAAVYQLLAWLTELKMKASMSAAEWETAKRQAADHVAERAEWAESEDLKEEYDVVRRAILLS